MHINLRQGIHCQVTLVRGKGSIELERVGPFHNLVVNNGKNNIADTTFNTLTTYCHAGSGSTDVLPGDTGLANFEAATNNVLTNVTSVKGSAPYYANCVKTFRFAEGTLTSKTIREVAFSTQATNGAIFSRALVLLPYGGKASVNVGATEWLDVIYEFRLYPQFVTDAGVPTDASGTIVIGASSYAFVIRPSNVTTTGYWDAQLCRAQWVAVSSAWLSSFSSTSALGLVSNQPTNPSGADATSVDSTIQHITYSAGSYNREIQLIIGLADCNASGGIGAVRFHTGMGAYQMTFTPAVPKNAGNTIRFIVNLAWDNKV